MRSFSSLVAVIAMTAGCTGDHDPTEVDPPGGEDVSVQSTAVGQAGAGETQAPGAMCAMPSAPGVLARMQFTTQADGMGLVMNGNGDVAMLANVQSGTNAEGNPVYTPGVARLDSALNKVFDYPHGSAVALDAQGVTYVAGGFSAPTDFGAGVVTPTGNVDTFLVTLSASGDVLSVRHLGILCGDGVSDLAVSVDGRIAISGTAMGTVVLETAAGDVVFRSDASGQVAFDAAGNLYIAGGAADGSGNVDAFVTKLDADGDVVYRQTFGDAVLPVRVLGYEQDRLVTEPMPQRFTDLAVTASGEVAAVGTYELEMSLLGVTVKTGSYFPSGSQLGTFHVRLDAAGNVTSGAAGFAINAFVGKPSVALGANGTLAISSNDPGNSQGPFAYPDLVLTTASGPSPIGFGGTGYAGYGLGVAVDACGNVLWASYANEPSLFDRHSFLTLVAP